MPGPALDFDFDPRRYYEQPVQGRPLSRRAAQRDVDARQRRLLAVQSALCTRVVQLGDERSLTDGLCVKLRQRLSQLYSIEYEVSRRFHRDYQERHSYLYWRGAL